MSDDDALPGLPEGFEVPDDLSGWLDGDDGTELLPSQGGVVSVIAGIGPEPGAPYITQVQPPSDDVSISLPGDRAVRYAMAVLAVAHRAHYFAAVYAQALSIMGHRGAGESSDNAWFLLRQLVEDLPELDQEATAPLRFVPFVHRRTGRGMVRVSLPPHTQPFTGWTFLEACDHAQAVLAQSVVSDLDSAYRTTIAAGFGAGEQRGRAAVGTLGEFFEHPDGKPYQDPDPGAGRRVFSVPGPPPGAKPAKGKKRRRR